VKGDAKYFIEHGMFYRIVLALCFDITVTFDWFG